MRTFITTYQGNERVLADCLYLLNCYFPVQPIIDRAPLGESKSSQLIRLLESIPDDYLILMEDDFLIVQPVVLPLLQQIRNFCISYQVHRFSLQSKEAHRCPNWDPTGFRIEGIPVYQSNPQVQNFISLEMSVWRRQFLLDHLEHGWSDADIENILSNRLRYETAKVYALDQVVVHYRDGLRDGKQSVYLLHNPLRLEAVESLALYPKGDYQNTVLYL